MNRLNSSEALAQYTSQFVTVKMSTSGADRKTWQEFHREFKGDHEGTVPVPFVYIVRSDGTTMFTGSGMMEVPEMGKLLHKALNQSGKLFSEKELGKLVEANQKILAWREKGDIKQAVAQLRDVSQLGPPGEIHSFAKPAIELNATVTQLITEGRTALTSITANLEKAKSGTDPDVTDSDRVKWLSEYLKVRGDFAGLKPLKRDFTKAKKLIQKDDVLSGMKKDLEVILDADSANSKTSVKRALKKLNSVLEKRTQGEIFDKATAAIAKLKEKSGG